MARCVRMAALGRPVVPLVKSSSMASSSCSSTSGSSVTPVTGTSFQSRSMMIVGTLPSARSVPSRRAARFSSMMTTLGSVSSMALRISAPVHQPFIATSTAPNDAHAQNVRIHSGLFAEQMATRSPLVMP